MGSHRVLAGLGGLLWGMWDLIAQGLIVWLGSCRVMSGKTLIVLTKDTPWSSRCTAEHLRRPKPSSA